jgi:coatomer subunit beta
MVRIKKCTSVEAAQYTALRTRVLLMLTSILRLGGSKFPTQPIDRDSAERVALCIQVLLGTEAELEKAFTDDSDSAFKSLHTQNKRETTTTTTHSNDNEVAIDTPIRFALLSPINTPKRAILLSPEAELDLVLSEDSTPTQPNTSVANLNRVVQLTGFSDAIYAETYVQMSGKEVLLDLLLVNQTEETLQNVSIDLLCAGDLKLIEKPPQLTLPAFAFSACKAIFKVTATNHGQIFGCISFLSGTQAAESETVILSEIKIDVLEYIKPAFIDETLFRDTWVLLEWENKISIKVAKAGELDAFLKYILAQGHLTCITPNVFIQKQQQQQQGKAEDASKENIPAFLACNLYAKSIFDEEILANLCLEINQNSKQITGHLRLRSKTQGLAVAFGDKLNTLIQKLK